jgi:hypothetical protein
MFFLDLTAYKQSSYKMNLRTFDILQSRYSDIMQIFYIRFYTIFYRRV